LVGREVSEWVSVYVSKAAHQHRVRDDDLDRCGRGG
jgi:hypothetical protein